MARQAGNVGRTDWRALQVARNDRAARNCHRWQKTIVVETDAGFALDHGDAATDAWRLVDRGGGDIHRAIR